jgi:HAD superfamily hydrolase (TIGR01509 family)
MNSEIMCFLFDLDNTLIGIPNTWEYFDNIIQETMEKKFQLAIPSRSERDTLWRSGKEYVTILKNWGVKDPPSFWLKFDEIDAVNRKNLIDQKELVLYDDVIDTLTALKKRKNIKLGVVTNTPTFIAEMEMVAYDIAKYFDGIIGLGDNQEICKPEPTGLQMILTQFGISPEFAIYVGDSSIDLIAAKRAHVKAALIDRSGNKRIDCSDHLGENDFDRIDSLLKILKY